MQEKSNEEKLEVIDGTITDFYWDRGTVNLLEQIQQKSKAKNVAIGVAAAATDMYGIVASSAALAMYEGEDVENFVCRIDNSIVCGQFSGANHLKNGDTVKAVVTQQGDVFFTHAILRHADEVLWLPVGSYMGSNADLRGNMRMARWGCSLVYMVLLILGYFMSTSKPIPTDIILIMIAIPPLLAFPVGFWVHNDMLPMAIRAERIFKALGFPYREDLNMSKAMYFLFKPATDDSLGSRTLSMFYYQKAIEFEKQRRLKKKLPI